MTDITVLNEKHLYHACIYEYIDIIKILCDAGVTMYDRDFASVCYNRDIETVKSVYNPRYPLFYATINACIQKNIEVVRFLISKNKNEAQNVYKYIIAEGINTTDEILQLLLST